MQIGSNTISYIIDEVEPTKRAKPNYNPNPYPFNLKPEYIPSASNSTTMDQSTKLKHTEMTYVHAHVSD